MAFESSLFSAVVSTAHDGASHCSVLSSGSFSAVSVAGRSIPADNSTRTSSFVAGLLLQPRPSQWILRREPVKTTCRPVWATRAAILRLLWPGFGGKDVSLFMGPPGGP